MSNNRTEYFSIEGKEAVGISQTIIFVEGMSQRLLVQITLLSSASQPAGQESVRTIGASGHRFKAKLTPVAHLVAGGPAVHATLEVDESESSAFLPPGTQFELWEKSRIGYGSVLGTR